jgi:hypothetical protein
VPHQSSSRGGAIIADSIRCRWYIEGLPEHFIQSWLLGGTVCATLRAGRPLGPCPAVAWQRSRRRHLLMLIAGRLHKLLLALLRALWRLLRLRRTLEEGCQCAGADTWRRCCQPSRRG